MCPLTHALMVMASTVLFAHAVGIANEEGAHTLLLTERDHPPGPLVAQVSDLAPFAGAHPAPSRLELAIAPRPFLAALACLNTSAYFSDTSS